MSISNGIALEQGSEATGYKVTRIETISAGTIDLEKVGLVKTSQDISAYKLKIGDILLSNINSLAHIGKSVFIDRDYDLYHGMNLLRLDVNRAKNEPKFIFYVINTNGIRVSLRERANKAVNQASINQTELGKTKIALPEITEQQKIADCLSSLDELIAAQARKVESLKTHKKGLMQQLFPREGETQPRLRFSEFQDAGDWEETRLGKLGKLVPGLTYSPDDVRESGLLVLRSSNVQNGEIALDDCVYVYPFIKGANLSQPEDILICVRNGSKALIGKCALIPQGMPLCTHGAFMTVFRADTSSFVFQLFQSDRYQKQVAGDLGATINSINGSQLLKYEFMVPKPAEQKRIANFLVSLDALITTANQELDTLKTHKKGLMQQLFPISELMEL